MIILKRNGTVYIANKIERDVRLSVALEPENADVWHPGDKTERIIAVGGKDRFEDAIRYQKIFPRSLNKKTLVLNTYEKLVDIASKYELFDSKSGEYVAFASKDKAFVLFSDSSCLEVEDMVAFGKCSDCAVGIYDLDGAKDPMEFFKKAYKATEEIMGTREFPVMVLNTSNDKQEIIWG